VTTQKRKATPEISPTAMAIDVKDPSTPQTETAPTPDGNADGPAANPPAAHAAGNGVTAISPPAAERDTGVDEAADSNQPGDRAADQTADQPALHTDGRVDTLADGRPPGTVDGSTPATSADQSPGAEPVASTDDPVDAPTGLSGLTRRNELAGLTGRIAALEEAFALQRQAIADVSETVAGRIAGSVATEVERFTTDELVEAKRNLSLAAHSMAHLALGITESAENVTGELRPDALTALLQSFRAEVDNILLQLGYSPLDTRVGERFDPNRHRSLRRIPTDDIRLDRLIARVIRDGYRSETTKRILVYSDVEVHRHQSQ